MRSGIALSLRLHRAAVVATVAGAVAGTLLLYRLEALTRSEMKRLDLATCPDPTRLVPTRPGCFEHAMTFLSEPVGRLIHDPWLLLALLAVPLVVGAFLAAAAIPSGLVAGTHEFISTHGLNLATWVAV